jgi:pimeloyl-ACP methyl ester carboxylesterase
MIKRLSVDNQSKKNLRFYGKKPYSIAVVHGGPGAAGEMAPVAVALSSEKGVLEPLQAGVSIDGQIEELKGILKNHASLPCILVGFSWGAWLSFMCTAYYPELVRKLIIIGSGPFQTKYADTIHETRLRRLSQQEKAEVESLTELINNSAARGKDKVFVRLGTLLSKADAFDPIALESSVSEYRFDIFTKVWEEAAELRRNGELLQLASKIRCPMVAIHGDYDPHPPEGVLKPLSENLQEFSFFLLKNCGHKPWIERQARDEFYSLLRQELNV